MKLKKVKTICEILVAVECAMIPVTWIAAVAPVALGIAVGIMIGLLITLCVFMIGFWRCPDCGRGLGRLGKYEYCSHCGTKLDM